MCKIKAVTLVVLLVMSQIFIEISQNESVSGIAASQDTDVNLPPTVEIVPDVSSGKAPLTVHFDGEAYDEDGEIFSVEWDFQGDGLFEVSDSLQELKGSLKAAAVKQALQREYTFTKPGIFHSLVRVTDDKGKSSISSVTMQVYSGTPYLDISPSNKAGFEYMARAGYEAFFGSAAEDSVQFQMSDSWISYQLKDQYFGKMNPAKGVPEGNKIWYYDVFPNINLRYTVYDSVLLEEFILVKPMPISEITQSFEIHGVQYKMEEDGPVGFYNGDDLVFSIPRPVMYELNNPQEKSYGLHYEITADGDRYTIKKVIDDAEWLKKAKYPVAIDSSTQGELADPWEQQGLTPYGQYFENLNEYVDPLTGHLTIRHTDYTLSGRGLDLSVTRVYSTVVAYKQEEDQPGEYVPVATYQEAPTDLGYGWRLDFPWMEVEDEEPGKYMHLSNGAQVQTNFQNGTWENLVFGFTMVENPDNTYTKYRKNGIKEEYDSEGRLTSITDLNGNVITFTHGQYGLSSITDTVGRVLNFNYSGEKLTSISDGVRTTTYGYAGDKLVSVTDPLGRITTYTYLSGNSFLITGVTYPTGGFSTYDYGMIIPATGKLAPYKASESDGGETTYYVYKVDSDDTVTWTSPRDINAVTVSGGRPCVLQRDDGSLVMYFKDKYVWEEENCYWEGCPHDCQYICETVTHTEYWIKRSVSTDQHHWSAPENVVQVKSTTGNPVVIEKQDGSYIMYYKDKYVWTEQDCYWEGCPWDCQYICETITHTEYWIYRRTSTDGLIWGSPVKVQQTTFGVRNIAAIQKQDSTYLMCYTDKVGTKYYIRQKTSSNGTTWSSPSNIIQVDNGTGNPSLLQRDDGTIYLAYRKGDNYIYVLTNSGGGWSSPVQTTAAAQGDPALLETDSDIVIIYKGTDGHCYRISSTDGVTWSSPSQIAPNKIISDPATVTRKDRFYRVTTQYISASAADLVKVLEFSYEGEYYLPTSCNVLVRDDQTLQSSMHFEFDSKGRIVERISKDEQGIQTEKIVYTYNNKNRVIRQDFYAGASTDISYSAIMGYDNRGNVVYTKGSEGAEHFYSYANTDCTNQFVDSKGEPVSLFSNAFYTNSIPSNCRTLIVGEGFINNGKVTETYYKYDVNGNLTETKTLFPTRDYAVFSGTFDESTQTAFEFDLTGLPITDSILVISSIAVPTQEILHETHSEVGNGWLNSGSWSGKYFLADYLRCQPGEPPDCFDGETKIGPFEHCPGSPGYTGYTTWVEENRTQYVETSYSAVVNEYPGQTEYKLNSGLWTIITTGLGSGTTSVVVPASSFVQGLNMLQFQESNTYSTKFEWTLYIDQGAVPEEYVNTCAYDTYGNMISFTDAMNNTILFGYDSHHLHLTSVTNALNHTITATHDFDTGLLTSITDTKGNTTSYEYDILGRVTRKIHPDLTELEAVYNDAGNYVTIYDELDHYIIRYYDGLSRLSRIERYLSPTVILTETYSYNYLNRVETKEDPEGHIYSFGYDSLGRSKKLISPDSTYREIHHDDVTNTVSVTDENQHKKEYHYDWVGNLQWVKEYTDPVNYYLTQYTYDSRGHLTSLTDAHGNTTYYSYDLFGVTHIAYPDSTTVTNSYDAVGNLLQKTDGNGVTTFTYDALYQLTEVEYPDQSLSTFEYDSNGNRTLMVDSAGQTSCMYDNRNRLISQTQMIEGEPYTVSYGYDAASRLISLTYPDQIIVTLEYDFLDRLTTIPGYAQFTYTADSLFESVTYGNGITAGYQYDTCHRPVSIQAQKDDTDLLLMEYQYDLVGNITQMNYNRGSSDQQWVESVETYQYDWLDRLVGAQGDYGSVTYSYDALGNRISQNDLLYTYDSMNQLLSISGGTTYTYDQNGNTVTKKKGTDTFSYTYDGKNQLIRVEKNQKVQEKYVYDGDGRRTEKTELIESLQEYQTVIYVYSGPNVIYEKNLDTGNYAVYIYGSNGRIAKKVGGLTDYYLVDHLGSTRLITDESGNTITDVSYMPFGESSVNGEEDHYLYNGKERDSTGLYYYGARYYDPGIGRFLTRDPLKGNCTDPQSLNLYSYCLNNPLRYSDPLGFEVDEEILDIIRKIFSKLFGVDDPSLLGVDPEAYLEDFEGGVLAGLEKLIEDMGFDAEIDYSDVLGREVLVISVNIDGVDYREVKLYVDESEGEAGGYREKTKSIYISVDQHRTIAELLTTILHEICHHVLKKEAPRLTTEQEHFYIYYVELEYMNKLIESQKGMGGNSPYYPYSNIYYAGMSQHFVESVFLPIYLFYFLGVRTSVFEE